MRTSITCPNCQGDIASTAVICPKCQFVLQGDLRQKFGDSTTVSGKRKSKTRVIDMESPFSQSTTGTSMNLPMMPLRGGRKEQIDVAVITFSDDAEIRIPPCSAHHVSSFTLMPDSGTNYKAGLELVQNLTAGYRRVLLLVCGDGEANQGGGLFGCPSKAAIKAAQDLKDKGVRIATIGFEGPSYDPQFLRSLASNPALVEKTYSGRVQHSFVRATQTLTAGAAKDNGPMLFIYLIDESASMNEENKKPEVEAAFRESLQMLKQMAL